MKKIKWLIPALCLTLSLGALAACGEEKVPEDPNENEGNDPTYEITDGVYFTQADASHRILVKFYEDGSFYIEGMRGNAAKGSYEVKEESIIYRQGTEELTPDTEGALVSATQAVYFYEADGTTPFEINRSDLYADGTASNAIALADDALQNVTYDESTRTLLHSPLNPFSTSDEKAIEMYHFMLADESDIPDSAEGATVQDYTITLTQKGYEANLLGSDSIGSYTVSGNVYTLTGTLPKGSYGTITVSADGKTATYVSADDKTIELVAYAEAQGTVVATMEGSATVLAGGNPMTISFTLSFYNDFTAELVANMGTMSLTVATASWEIVGNGIEFGSVSNGTFGETQLVENYTKVNITWSGDLSANVTDAEVTLEAAASALSALKEVPPVVKALQTYSGSAYSGAVSLVFTIYDDGTCELVGNGTSVVASGTWTQATPTSFPTIELDNGTAVVSYADGQVYLTYTGNLGAGSEVTCTLNKD